MITYVPNQSPTSTFNPPHVYDINHQVPDFSTSYTHSINGCLESIVESDMGLFAKSYHILSIPKLFIQSLWYLARAGYRAAVAPYRRIAISSEITIATCFKNYIFKALISMAKNTKDTCISSSSMYIFFLIILFTYLSTEDTLGGSFNTASCNHLFIYFFFFFVRSMFWCVRRIDTLDL